jgi:SNF2 family DNA or RNA helicase
MLTIEKDNIYFTATEQTARSLDGVWVKSKNAYKVPNTLGALRELHKAGYDVAEYGKKKSQIRTDFLELKNNENPSFNLDNRLRPYQRVDISFLTQLPHAGVFNDPRTGKSVTALKTFEVEGRKKNLLVCPASLVLNWSNEIKKFTDKTPFPVNGNKAKRMKIYEAFKAAEEGYLIISKDTLRQDVTILETL